MTRVLWWIRWSWSSPTWTSNPSPPGPCPTRIPSESSLTSSAPKSSRTCHSADPSFRKGIVDRFFPARSFCIGFSNNGNGTSFRKGCNYRAAAAYFSFSSKRRVS
nr:uncharacterized protein LOC103448692 isoform X2 [Malus domestica]